MNTRYPVEVYSHTPSAWLSPSASLAVTEWQPGCRRVPDWLG